MTGFVNSPPPSSALDRERSSYYWRRRIARHLMIAFATAGCTALFWQLFSTRQDLISHFSIATAYPALVLTAAALVLGPCNVLRGRHTPVCFVYRRDLVSIDNSMHSSNPAERLIGYKLGRT